MPLFTRPDATRPRALNPLRRTMPILMPGRNEAAVYFEQRLELADTLAWLDAANADRPHDDRYKLFDLVLTAAVRTLALRPRLNRFVAGGRLWQRDHIALGFAVKPERSDHSGIRTVKQRFAPDITLPQLRAQVRDAIEQGRTGPESGPEQEMRLLTHLPVSIMRRLMRLQRTLDALGLIPAALLRDDPLYSSIMLANLGSIGLDAPYHHLFEYGTTSLFITLGTIKQAPVVLSDGQVAARPVIDLKYTLDERIADGFYCALSIELFQNLLLDPDTLRSPPDALPSTE